MNTYSIFLSGSPFPHDVKATGIEFFNDKYVLKNGVEIVAVIPDGALVYKTSA